MVNFKSSRVFLLFLLSLSIIFFGIRLRKIHVILRSIHEMKDDNVKYEYVQKTHTKIRRERPAKFKDHFLNNDPNITVVPDYFRKNIFTTSENATADSNETSICTQLSISNTTLSRILDIADNWEGKVSVAVFFKDGTNRSQLDLFTKFYNDNTDVFQDRFAFHFVMDNMVDRQRDYPINMMRNVAIEYSVTKYVLSLDVDFIPSQTAFADIDTHVDRLMKKDKVSMNVLVIPAFEKLLPIEKSWIFPESKRELIEIKEEYHVLQFHRFFPGGHGPTKFPRWYSCNESYSIPYRYRYEPYVVVQKSHALPPFWEHFFGFGINKMSWVEELGSIGYEFHVLPESFLIHINHVEHGGRRVHKKETITEYKRFQNYLKERYNKTKKRKMRA